MNNTRPGIYISLAHIPPRKRKIRNTGVSGENFEEAFQKAKEWKKKLGGKFVKGHSQACSFYEVDFHGEKIAMVSLPIFVDVKPLNEDQLKELNS